MRCSSAKSASSSAASQVTTLAVYLIQRLIGAVSGGAAIICLLCTHRSNHPAFTGKSTLVTNCSLRAGNILREPSQSGCAELCTKKRLKLQLGHFDVDIGRSADSQDRAGSREVT